MKLVIADELQIKDSDIESLKEVTDLTVFNTKVSEEREIIERIKKAEIITVNYFDLTRNIIGKATKLKYVIVPATGYDWIDVEACNERGIKVQNCPTHNSAAVAEHAMGLMFAVARRTIEANRHIISGKWFPGSLTGIELQGKKLLTIGHGNIGKKICTLARNIGMQTDYVNSKTTDSELKDKIKESDVVVLCYPLNEKTIGSFNKEKLDLLKKEAILINVGRGLLLDQDHLKFKLENNEIYGAGLDVFNRDEVLLEGRDDIIELAKLNNVVATPHIGFNSKEAGERLSAEIVQNVRSILQGNPVNVVN